MNKIVRIGMDWAGRVALTGLVLGSLASSTLAGPPSFKQIFKKKEAASQAASSLMLTAEHGPWLIMAHTFQGEERREARHRPGQRTPQQLWTASVHLSQDL